MSIRIDPQQRILPPGKPSRSRRDETAKKTKEVDKALEISPAVGESVELRVIFTESQIQRRVAQMASRVNHDYCGRTLHLVTLLENSFMFLADLTRQLQMPVVCHFLKARVKDRNWHGVPLREINYAATGSFKGKDVLLVDGVLQTGVTEDFLLLSIKDQEPNSLRTATLIEKVTSRKVSLTPDYVGFRADGQFLVGYGLGLNGEYSHLPYIA
ncbi:MAG: phosphoribosyltransferase, partial [Terriglobia bacterium]